MRVDRNASVRIVPPPGCKDVTVDGRMHPVVDGAATVPIEQARLKSLKAVTDALPGQMWSLGRSTQAELRCVECGRTKLKLFGNCCAHCGGWCVEVGQ